MKLFIAALAFVIAAPAAAQTADPHAAHHSGQDGDKSDGHEAKMMDCCKDKNGNGKPDCSEGKMSCCATGKDSGGAEHSHH